MKSQADQFNGTSCSAHSVFWAHEACTHLALPCPFPGCLKRVLLGLGLGYWRFQSSLIFTEPDLWGGLSCHSFWDLLG